MRLRFLAVLSVVAAVLLGRAAPAATAGVPALDHVIVIVMENQDWAQARNVPYITSLRLSGTEMVASYGVSLAASQPNYFALWAGSTFGVTTNACPLSGVPATAENLGHALEAAGKTWRAYSEDLSAPGGPECSSSGASPLYTRKHEPWTNFSNLDHNNERVYSDLATDIANHTLPNLAFVIPNNCHNTHNTGCTLAMGDTWLSQNLPGMIAALDSAGIIILTWDEDHGTRGNDNHILTVFEGKRVRPGCQCTMPIDHYNVLRTVCDALGLAPIGHAATHEPITEIWSDDPLGVPADPGGNFRLSSPAPNPSDGAITARLTLPEAMPVEAGIYDIAGHAIRKLTSCVQCPTMELRWDGRRDDGLQAGAGIYLLKVRAGDQTLQRKAVVIR